MEKRNLTCIECPMGCSITVEMDDGKVLSVEGNSCKRGDLYARNEVVCPTRVLTTTVRLTDGRVVAVKTDKPIKKEKMMDLMKEISRILIEGPVKIGDVLVEDFSDGANLVATANSD